MSYNTDLQSHNTKIQNLIDIVNSLPEAGSSGTDTADATITADTVFKNKIGYGKDGKVVGTFTIDNELDTQQTLLDEIDALLDTKIIVKAQEKTVTPNETEQVITPDTGYDVLSKVIVSAISGNNSTIGDVLPSMDNDELCSLFIDCNNVISVTCFQKDIDTNCTDMVTLYNIYHNTIQNIPKNSILFISVANGDEPSNCINLLEIDGDKYTIIGQSSYYVYKIQGDATFKCASIEYWPDYFITKSGDTNHYQLTNKGTYLPNGFSYSTGIDTGMYGINTVTVTMDGIDITSTAYDGNDIIRIPQITGNIDINVTVIEPTNLVPLSTTTYNGTEVFNSTGYQDEYRWSSSSAGPVSYAGARITGWMPYVKGSRYILKNFNPKTGYTTGLYIAYSNASGTFTTVSTGLDTTANYVIDKDNDIIEILLQNSSYKYFRVSGYSGTDVPEVYRMCSITLTCDDTHFKLSNSSIEIAQGLSYKATIENVPGVYWNINSVTITMDGIDVTSSTYDSNTKTISISEVIGNIIITINESMEGIENDW